MPKLEISDALLRNTLLEVAPLVSRVTGWDLGLPTLNCRLLPRNQGYEAILLGRFQHIGVDGWEEMMPDIIERLIEYMIEANTLAAYMPGSEEILVMRENVDDSNLDGLKLVLGHELVHRGQHLAHGELFRRVDRLIQQVFIEMQNQSADFQRIQLAFEQIQPIMTLLESHASYVQALLRQAYFPDAQIENPFNLATMLMRLVGAPKLAQYSDGLPQVNAAYNAGTIDHLYRNL